MKKSTGNTTNQRKDIYQEITNIVISELEKGNVIWKQGWNSYGKPKNIVAGNKYRGWNSIWLNFITSNRGFKAPFYLTFKHAQAKGGNIKKGEKGFPVIYWLQYESTNPADTVVDRDGNERIRKYRVPKYYTVFNLDQTEGIDIEIPELEQSLTENERIDRCEQVVKNMPHCPLISPKGDAAYYDPTLDEVVMPPFSLFYSGVKYYSTLFHELGHSTGHQSRLNRPEVTGNIVFGKEDYSKEELVAEFTASFLCGMCDIRENFEDNAGYIGRWLNRLKEDKTLLVRAASQAQLDSDYILNVKEEIHREEDILIAA